MRLDQGGHLTHGSPASMTSKAWHFVSYGVTARNDDPEHPGEMIDFDKVRELAREHRPKFIVAGATAYSRQIHPAPFREIADEVGALLMFDSRTSRVSSRAGPTPVRFLTPTWSPSPRTRPCADRAAAQSCVVRSTQRIDSAVFPGQQGGPLEHAIAAKAVAFKEASPTSFPPTPAGS